jgi:hypothetical protein
VGPCNPSCAASYWAQYGKAASGPICGVPGCSEPESGDASSDDHA